MSEFKKGNKKVANAWAMYDWANSVYHLVITSTLFPIYYTAVSTTKTSDLVTFLGITMPSLALYNYALSFAFLVIAVLAPLLSGIADYSGNKKIFMRFFCYTGALSCSLMYFFTSANLWLGILLVVMACISYAGSIVFYNAYLPEIVEPEDQNRLSAKGFSLGYIGSSILLIINLIMVQFPHAFGFTGDNAVGMATRWSFVTVGVWWFGFAQITFYYLPVNPFGDKGRKEKINIWKGYQELVKVWNLLKETKRLRRFLIAFFIYNTGVRTIMLVANQFGSDTLKLKEQDLILTILIIQFVAVGGAYMFSYVAKKINDVFMLKVATFIWVGICIGAYLTYTSVQFFILAFFVGLVMGGIQALSRSTYSKMLPETQDHASFFSFYDVCENVGSVVGLFLYGWVFNLTHDMRNSIAFLLSLFVLGFIFLNRIPKANAEKSLA
ncbi:MAG TPA: MFS transporter [Bacteroidia bacterium]|jgi:UMF1 family MFS transporter|nr:MFS transporter [Bacteroidia bacterium]